MDLAGVIALAVNIGSSSIKVDGVRSDGARAFDRSLDLGQCTAPDVPGLLDDLWNSIPEADRADIAVIGHRVVHGGRRFDAPALIDAEVRAEIERCIPLAPVHNPANLAGIDAMFRLAPDIPQVAVFDTAFHRSMPTPARTYPLPLKLSTELGIERFGFHGISIAGAVRQTAALMKRTASDLRLVVAHLGSGASVTAVRDGRSVDTTMGWTPLEGVMMSTRSGDLDPAIVLALVDHLGSTTAVTDLLEHGSGLVGLGGASDMRTIERLKADGDASAEVAWAVYVHRLRRAIGSMHAVVGGADALVFTAGIGEHDPRLREAVCAGWARLGIDVDLTRNREVTAPSRAIDIAALGAPVRIIVVPADEGAEIAHPSRELLAQDPTASPAP